MMQALSRVSGFKKRLNLSGKHKDTALACTRAQRDAKTLQMRTREYGAERAHVQKESPSALLSPAIFNSAPMAVSGCAAGVRNRLDFSGIVERRTCDQMGWAVPHCRRHCLTLLIVCAAIVSVRAGEGDEGGGGSTGVASVSSSRSDLVRLGSELQAFAAEELGDDLFKDVKAMTTALSRALIGKGESRVRRAAGACALPSPSSSTCLEFWQRRTSLP
jgi:hypothetical protein